MEYLVGQVDVFILILIRITAIFIISPIFGRRNVPVIMKIGLGLLITFILLPGIHADLKGQYNSIFEYLFLVLNEFLVGLILGFVSYLVLSAIYIGGELIDMQMGFGMVNVLDPMSNIQAPLMANFLNIFAMLVFLMMDGHHIVISSLFYSYKVLPIGHAVITNTLVNHMVVLFGDMFVIGFKIASPIIAAVFITDVSLGILSRMVPQMNIFMLGMPIKIVIGLITLSLVIPVFFIIMEAVNNGMFHDFETVLKDMVIK